MKTTSLLHRLPRELRDVLFALTAPQNSIIKLRIVSKRQRDSSVEAYNVQLIDRLPALLRAIPSLATEVLPLHYQLNTFRFNTRLGDDHWTLFHSWLAAGGKILEDSLRHLQISFNSFAPGTSINFYPTIDIQRIGKEDLKVSLLVPPTLHPRCRCTV